MEKISILNQARFQYTHQKLRPLIEKKDDFHTKTISKKCTGYHMKYPSKHATFLYGISYPFFEIGVIFTTKYLYIINENIVFKCGGPVWTKKVFVVANAPLVHCITFRNLASRVKLQFWSTFKLFEPDPKCRFEQFESGPKLQFDT